MGFDIEFKDVLGYDWTPNLCPKGFPTPSALTLAMMTLSLMCAKASATCS